MAVFCLNNKQETICANFAYLFALHTSNFYCTLFCLYVVCHVPLCCVLSTPQTSVCDHSPGLSISYKVSIHLHTSYPLHIPTRMFQADILTQGAVNWITYRRRELPPPSQTAISSEYGRNFSCGNFEKHGEKQNAQFLILLSTLPNFPRVWKELGSQRFLLAGPSGRVDWGLGLRPLAFWDCGFESRRGHRCLPVVSVVCCQVEISASGWSLVQRSPTECVCVCVCLSVIVNPRQCGGLGSLGAVAP